MTRILQFRDYEETTTFVLEKYNEDIVNAIKEITSLTSAYPGELYFDFEVNNVLQNNISNIINIKNWYYEQKCELIYKDYKEKYDLINKYLKVIFDFFKFD